MNSPSRQIFSSEIPFHIVIVDGQRFSPFRKETCSTTICILCLLWKGGSREWEQNFRSIIMNGHGIF